MIRILVGDCRERLREFPDGYFHCCVVSWPYWGLRDYGIPPAVWGGDAECEHVWGDHQVGRVTDGGDRPPDNKWPNGPSPDSQTVRSFCQLCGAWLGNFGLEPTPEFYVEHGVEISRQVRRVLRDDGTMWLNLGDTYWGGKGQSGHADPDYQALRVVHGESFSHVSSHVAGHGRIRPQDHQHPTIKPKDLVGIPWMVAFALRDDGWWLRSAIIWHKPNCMPESVRDRPTVDYEYVFLLAKSRQYFYDQDAIREPQTGNAHSRGHGMNPKGALAERGRDRANDSFHASTAKYVDVPGGRNKRAVWTIPTSPFVGAHFATFPPELVEPCIKAGTSERGACPECGAPWERVVERAMWGTHDSASAYPEGSNAKNLSLSRQFYRKQYDTEGPPPPVTIGWRPTCSCYDDRYGEMPQDEWPTVPCRVLDHMGGVGTTGMVADRLGRDAVIIDIKPEYARMAYDRIVEDAGPMFAEVELVNE